MARKHGTANAGHVLKVAQKDVEIRQSLAAATFLKAERQAKLRQQDARIFAFLRENGQEELAAGKLRYLKQKAAADRITSN